MNTKKIYNAQLSVSKIINADYINDLVSRLSSLGESKYNCNSKSVMIKIQGNPNETDEATIRYILKEWITDMDIDQEDYNVLIDNIDILFNITKINFPNIPYHIINVYLY